MFTVLIDTCVLHPSYLRDTLLSLAEREFFRPLWSIDILNELYDSLTEQAGIGHDAASRVIEEMQHHFVDCCVSDYEQLIDRMWSPDEDDRHVLAAAVRGHAAAIVTFNTADFPPESVEPFQMEAIHPDDFLLDQLDLSPPGVIAVLETQVERYKREPNTIYGLLEALERAGTPNFADEVRRFVG